MRTVSLLCATGTLMQTFLSVIGFSESQIYLHATLVQAVNVSTILLFSHYADCKRPFLRSALAQIPNAILFLFFLPFCLRTEASTSAFFLIVTVSLLQSVCTALNTVMEYKLPYYLYRAEEYGPVQAISGVLISLVTFGVGELLHYLQAAMPYERLMLFAFIISAVFMLLAGIFSFFYTALTRKEWSGRTDEADESVKETSALEVKTVSVLDVFRRPVFYMLIPANLLRGVASGAVTVFATVALTMGHEADITTRMVSLSAIANLVACFLFGIASRYLSPRISIFVCGLCYLLIPLCLFDSAPLFLVAYAVIFFGKSVIDIAVPSLLVQAVDIEIAGPYNAWRMILHNGGMMLATAIAPFLTPAALLFLTLGCGLLSGIMFFALPLLRRASPTFLRGRSRFLK